jgi:hypothetical protein
MGVSSQSSPAAMAAHRLFDAGVRSAGSRRRRRVRLRIEPSHPRTRSTVDIDNRRRPAATHRCVPIPDADPSGVGDRGLAPSRVGTRTLRNCPRRRGPRIAKPQRGGHDASALARYGCFLRDLGPGALRGLGVRVRPLRCGPPRSRRPCVPPPTPSFANCWQTSGSRTPRPHRPTRDLHVHGRAGGTRTRDLWSPRPTR